MPHFSTTGTILDKILTHKAKELSARMGQQPVAEIVKAAQAAAPPLDILKSLKGETVALIAEVKHASPSRGVLVEDFDPVLLAETYEKNGAAAISVLTDEKFFLGHLDFLTSIRRAVNLPILRKDFIIDAYQVYEARAAGADALLLIVAALDEVQLHDLHTLTRELGMHALVEVHNQRELERAIPVGPALVGINNRDLKTFDVNLNTTARLVDEVPEGVICVAESGILQPSDVLKMGQLGAHAVLVGEALVKSDDLASTVHLFSDQPRVPRDTIARNHSRVGL